MTDLVVKKTEFIDQIARKTHFSKVDVKKILDVILEEIILAAENGKRLSLPKFGSFNVGTRKASIRLHLRTREPISVPESQVPRFTASKDFKERVKAGGKKMAQTKVS